MGLGNLVLRVQSGGIDKRPLLENTMFRADVCIHYNGVAGKTCKADVEYRSVCASREQCVNLSNKVPCFSKNGLTDLCAKFRLPSQEEIEEYERSITIFLEQMIATRKAITDHIKEHRMGGRDVEGKIPCPVCGDGTVFYSCAGAYNGHIHATCNTDGCVSWIE